MGQAMSEPASETRSAVIAGTRDHHIPTAPGPPTSPTGVGAPAAGPRIAPPKNIGLPRSQWVGGIRMPMRNRSGSTLNTFDSKDLELSESLSCQTFQLEPYGGCSATHRTRKRHPTALAP